MLTIDLNPVLGVKVVGRFLLKVLEEQDQFVIINLFGDIQQNSAFTLLGEVEKLLQSGKKFQIWNFEKVSSLNPESIQYLIEPIKECCKADGAVYFFGLPTDIAEIFSRCGLNKLKNQINSRAEAKKQPMPWLPDTLEKSMLQSLQTLIIRKVPASAPPRSLLTPKKTQPASAPQFDIQNVFSQYSSKSIEATMDVPQEEYLAPVATNTPSAPKRPSLEDKYSEGFIQNTIQMDNEATLDGFEEVSLEEFEKHSSPSSSSKYKTDYIEETINIPEEEMSRLSTRHSTQVLEEKTTFSPKDSSSSEAANVAPSSSEDEELNEIQADTTFKIIEKIAVGGMGKVYKAKLVACNDFEKTVAIKTILPEFCQDPKFTKMFINEAKLVADLVHDNIVQIYQLGQFRSGYFITMEYIDGKDLTQFLKRHWKLNRPIPLELATFIMSRICRALDFAHNKTDRRGKSLHIIHRDVSPQNIMFTRAGVVKLTDFGIVKAKSVASSAKKQLAGKLQYMSPEVAEFKEVDHRADIYSLGAVFYELLTDRPPITPSRNETLNESLAKIVEQPIVPIRKFNPQVSQELEQFVLTCLAKNPNQRYQNARIMLEYLEKYLYSGGYGPTNNTLAEYLKEIFQDLRFDQVETTEEEEMSEISFASLAMRQGYITQEHVKECLVLQGTLAAEHGKRENIGALLVRKKYLNLDQLLNVLKLQKIYVYKCNACGNQYNIVSPKQGQNYPCKRCESPLEEVKKLTNPGCDGQFEG